MSRSTRPPVIVVQVIKTAVSKPLPAFLSLGQRHFEKEKPAGEKMGDYGTEGVSYVIPLDLLRLYHVSEILLEDVEEVRVVYKARK